MKWIVSTTGQTSKLIVGLSLLAVGGMVNLWAILYSGSDSFDPAALLAQIQLPSALVALVGLAYVCFSIKCPNCGARWIWMAVRGKLQGHSLGSLLDLRACPTCGKSSEE
jgi:predicted RNA-binding Zn-ribbon protein involved in translation (DUF1610 family)